VDWETRQRKRFRQEVISQCSFTFQYLEERSMPGMGRVLGAGDRRLLA